MTYIIIFELHFNFWHKCDTVTFTIQNSLHGSFIKSNLQKFEKEERMKSGV